MKRNLLILIAVLLVGVLVVGCGGSQEASVKADKIVVGATPVPHAEILNDVVKGLLEKEGITLEVKEFTDYVTPNLALADGSIDANFFQHTPYLNNFAEERGLDLVSIAKVHVEPIGLYSKKISKLEELKDGSVIAIPSDATNEGRALLLLESKGLIKLSDKAGLTATPVDIVENPKNLEFKELEAAQLPRVLKDVTAAIINTNYALEADLVPTKDALIIEGSESPYANILAVRTEDKDNETLQKLVKALNSPEVKEYIADKYKGAIVPAF
ncbi:D-methionine transport system substrate-binding protein [Orenia metallireducens]|jgi:D-methionine transport system substrate-binding protein|uniref:Lipoprotein n=1 Tax=Orenia metallireducens TaxID=1413210 RepID=A0A285GBQ6_9FIRM|nr:MetQ/NlpA family ABC transporter substrate-binding protein [Orenia metallireducens]PRX32518.1 D-methionine transport system substrate-binding protein [Orenia metallireducens]SNY21007.1 D-methionine transport system substrate-binding protein [Orenia metallireducens]